jgi:hypothetical protein
MSDHRGRSHHAAWPDLVPVAAVVMLGALLLGVATLWDGGAPEPAVASDGSQAAMAGTSNTSRARHDVEDRQVAGELGEPLTASRPANGSRSAERPPIAAETRRTKVRKVSFRIATFNVLATHLAHRSWPGSGWRTGQAVAYIRNAGISVIGLQEATSSQLAGITSGTGFRAWPGGSIPEDSVAWDPSVFEFVSGETFSVPGVRRTYPIVRLRHRRTDLEMFVVNVHTAAGGGREAGLRSAGHRASVATVNRLKSARIPIFLTGDMNDREAFFCAVLPPTGMVAAVGGSISGGCRPPGSMPVDWIVATPDVTFSNFVNDKSAVARRVSDHHFVSATATIAGAG